MIQRIKKSGKLFRKYFVYYILVLLIPIIVTTVGLGYFSYEQNEKQVSEYADSIISLIGVSFDDTFNSIYAVNELIVNDDKLKHVYREQENHYDLYEYHNHLQNIKTIVPFLENIIIINAQGDSEYIVSSKGTYIPSFFYNKLYLFESELTLVALSENGTNLTKGKVDGQNMLAYVLPGAHSKALNAYIIPQENFDAILRENELMHSRVVIMDAQNNMLYNYNEDNSEMDLNLHALNENESIRIDSKEYIVRMQNSKSTGLIYIIMTPVNNIANSVSSLMLIYSVCVLAIIIIGFVFSFTLAKKTTMPIYNLSDMVKNELEAGENKTDEIGKISFAITSMNSRIEKMKNIMVQTNDDVIYINLMKLLIGEISLLEEINENLQPTNIVLNSNYYTVAIYDCDKPLNGKNKMPGVKQKIVKSDENEKHIFYLNSYDTNYIYVLIMSDSVIADVEGFLCSIKQEIFNDFACDIALAYSGGNFYFNEISTAFYSSVFTLNYKYVMGKNSVLNSELIQLESKKSKESFNYKEYYKLLLGGTNEDVIQYISDYNMKISYAYSGNVHEIKAGIFGIFNFLHDTFPLLVSNYQSRVSALLENYNTAEEFLNYICDISVYICENLKISNSDDKYLRINRFIDENYHKDNFSMQLVADEVQMSVSTLSKYYKEIAGINISEAVNKLKIDKAKELLINTDLSVNEIVLNIGYYNASSFIRKFKEYTSVTPGKFREKHKCQNTLEKNNDLTEM